ncbi:MAG: COX15/CtaA family protein [Rickettsiales bacterium]|nr:COX15/CtaA family protein [Rickettsiales bacterium]
MIILGGFTRLTDSGLSITEWGVVSGIIPPLSQHDWSVLFRKYQEIPEFKLINFAMSIDGFKQIFWLEYLHRILGRILGIITISGFFAFLTCKTFSGKQKKHISIITVLIPIQGVIGWFMVKSGLSDDIDVSHYMLALHLTTAFALLFILARFYYDEYHESLVIKERAGYLFFLRAIICVAFLQVVFGALVAGLNAGLIYNEFPFMGEGYLPREIYDNNLLSPSLVENPAIVQFIHRNIAFILSGLIILFGYKFYKTFNIYIKKQYKLVIYLLLLQMLIGVLVLLTSVNIYLAILHQFIAAIFIYRLSWLYMSVLKN